MRRRPGAWVRAAGCGLVVVALAALGGCGRSTPGCDRAAADLAAARLAAAAEAYAHANEQGEGDCADAGLHTVGVRYVTAFQNVARGRTAEAVHDRDAAATAYRAALGDDADNAAARDGLARLGLPSPSAAPPAPVTAPAAAPATPAPAASGPSRLVVALLTVALALLGAVAVLLAVLLWGTRRQAAALPDDRLDAVRHRIEEILQADASTRPGWADEQLAALRTLQQDLDTLTRRTADRDHRPEWADEQLAVLRALQQNLDVLTRRDAERATATNGGCTAHQQSGQLRRDLVDLVAFLDHRLPGRGATHDRFGIPALEPETSA
jgi:hypothetical protein